MSAFTVNPEFLRNARIQLRPGRAIAAAVICAAVSLTIWYSFESHSHAGMAAFNAREMFKVILQLQILVLLIGGGIYELLTVHREKELNTFDFQRVTRLSSFELGMGKLFGAPILTYFIVLCLMPITIVSAILGYPPALLSVGAYTVLLIEAYIILLVGCIVFHLLALVFSMALGRGVSVLAVLPYLVLVGFTSVDLAETRNGVVLSNWTVHQLNPFAAAALFDVDSLNGFVARDLFFGVPVPHFIVLMAIYATLIAWFLLAIVRNLKRDPTAYELYSPLQAFGFAVYLNLLMLGFFNWKSPQGQPIFSNGQITGFTAVPAREIGDMLLSISFWLFALLGLVLLRNRERVRRRIQALGERAAGFWAALWPTPYLLGGVIAVGLAIVELIRVYRNPASNEWNWGLALVSIAFYALWVARDVLYLQWMGLRRRRRPLASAVIYLLVFYTCTGIIFGVAHVLLRASVAPYSAMLIPSAMSSLSIADWSGHYQLWLVALAVLAGEVLLFAFLQRQKLREFLAPSAAPQPTSGHKHDASLHLSS